MLEYAKGETSFTTILAAGIAGLGTVASAAKCSKLTSVLDTDPATSM
jgi:hypothetical protein